ncbi:MAG: LuxR C-terminal-related transcriptional regulator [Acidobacteriota bacterium]|nr:LuxR C-terminal-related transcriptional regulator [Acidobacteriota bacterium]
MGHAYDFLANTTDGVFAVDRQQRIVLWNHGATTILGHEPAEVLGRKCYRLLRGRDAGGCTICRPDCELICAARRHECVPNSDVRAPTKEGQDVWLNVSTVVVPGRNSSLSALVHLFHEANRKHEVEDVVEHLASSLAQLAVADPPAPAVNEAEEEDGQEPDLTPREREVLGLLAAGLSTTAIAKRLCISPRTVSNHAQSVLEKLGVHSRLEAVTYSIKNGLI